jgi:hypothetical protein
MDKIKLAHEVLDLVFRANGGFVERAGKDEPTGEPTAFFTFSGHCPCVDAQIFPKGWHRDADYSKERVEFEFDDWNEDEELEEKLNQLRECVKELEKREAQHD